MDRVYGFDDDGIAIGGPVNVAYKDINCAECGAGCAVCYSFSVMKANHRGFGGRPCARAQDCLKCACCQIIIKNCSKDAMREIILGVRDMWLRRNS
jgi:hypothetical protein